MSELSQRVKELKLARTPHSLTTFITFYMYHQHSMYINYMHDSKVILDWLTNEGNMPLDLEDDKFDKLKQDSKLMLLSSMCHSYAIGELARIVAHNMGKKYDLKFNRELCTRVALIVLTH